MGAKSRQNVVRGIHTGKVDKKELHKTLCSLPGTIALSTSETELCHQLFLGAVLLSLFG